MPKHNTTVMPITTKLQSCLVRRVHHQNTVHNAGAGAGAAIKNVDVVDVKEPQQMRLIRWADEVQVEVEGAATNNSAFTNYPLEEVFFIPQRKIRFTQEQRVKIKLLAMAFCTFLSFAIVQMVVAIVAQSQSLVGDSAIMIADSMTYLCNCIAEVRKDKHSQYAKRATSTIRTHNANANANYHENTNNNNIMSPQELKAIRERGRRKIVLQMEIFPPIISMTSLLIVVSFLFNKSIRVLRDELQQPDGDEDNDEDDPNVQIMMGFAFFNLCLDILNFTCFARARHHLLGAPSSASAADTTDAAAVLSKRKRKSKSSKCIKGNATTAVGTPHNTARREHACCDVAEKANQQEGGDTEDLLSNGGICAHGGNNARRHENSIEMTTWNDESSSTHYVAQEEEGEEKITLEEENEDIESCDDCVVAPAAASSATSFPANDSQSFMLRKRSTTNSSNSTTTENNHTQEDQNGNDDNNKKKRGPANLNMCSAFAHVFADMLRSIAVIVAAVVAKAAPGVSPEIADGAAALVVYSLILVSIAPVVRGLYQVVPEYRSILAQERAEAKASLLLIS